MSTDQTETGAGGKLVIRDGDVHTQRARSGWTRRRDHLNTIPHAKAALERIVLLRHPADPPGFEVWYTYSAGKNAGLNEKINRILQRSGTLTFAELDQIYDEFLSPTVAAKRIDGVGSKFGAEIDRVNSIVDAAISSSTSYGENLAGASQKLGSADQESFRAIVEQLAEATEIAGRENRALQNNLTESKQQIQDLQASLEAIRTESYTDSLTKLSNRKHFDEALERTVANGSLNGKPLSLLMCDVDHFKQFNDTYGHTVGDHVLRLLAAAIRQSIRDEDFAARYGGEEFAVILPNTTMPQATVVAEKIRRSVIGKELTRRSTGERLGRISVSIGIAEWHADDVLESLIERADACLYRAKRSGRNRVVSEIGVEAARKASPITPICNDDRQPAHANALSR